MADPVGVQVLEGLHDRLSAEQLAAVGDEREAGSAGDGEGGPKSAMRPRRSSLDSPKPTTSPASSPAYRAARRASVRASSGWRIRLAATTTADPDAPLRRHLAGLVEHDLEGGVMPPTKGA